MITYIDFEVEQTNIVLEVIKKINNSNVIIRPTTHRNGDVIKFRVHVENRTSDESEVKSFIDELNLLINPKK